jgi:16S rRNA (uracil1498-N3)-methyltransferase
MRRLIIDRVAVGALPLDPQQSHHARDVLRLEIGTVVEVFDAAGRSAVGTVSQLLPVVVVDVPAVTENTVVPLTVASAVPKGDRADWLAEKLTEVGVTDWRPLRTTRSVVHPEGKGKTDRWHRIAAEAAKQSKRVGMLRIADLESVAALPLAEIGRRGVVLSTGPDARPLSLVAAEGGIDWLLVGPEGGWTPDEEAAFAAAGLTRATLGPTILRIETAAVVAAGIVTASRPK